MNNLLIETNKNYMIKNFVNPLYDTIRQKNNLIEELRLCIKNLEKRRIELARGYAEKIGVLLTKKQFQRR